MRKPVCEPKAPRETADTGATPAPDSMPPRTALGARLLRLRKEIVRSGLPLLGWEDLDREVAERRGRGDETV